MTYIHSWVSAEARGTMGVRCGTSHWLFQHIPFTVRCGLCYGSSLCFLGCEEAMLASSCAHAEIPIPSCRFWGSSFSFLGSGL